MHVYAIQRYTRLPCQHYRELFLPVTLNTAAMQFAFPDRPVQEPSRYATMPDCMRTRNALHGLACSTGSDTNTCASPGAHGAVCTMESMPAHQHHSSGLHIWSPGLQEFEGPWSRGAVGEYINRRCARVARIGRVYAADILAAHFANASSRADQQSILHSLQLLQVHHSDGHHDVPAKEFFRYYAEVMEVRMLPSFIASMLLFLSTFHRGTSKSGYSAWAPRSSPGQGWR